MTRLAHEAGALVLIDGAQAVAHQVVDVQAIGCDFYIFSGPKLYGPTGMGALYARYEVFTGMPPWQGGGDIIHTVSFELLPYVYVRHRYEAGHTNLASGRRGRCGWGARWSR